MHNIWQVPVGTPQMNGISLDLFRAGIRGKPDRDKFVAEQLMVKCPSKYQGLEGNG